LGKISITVASKYEDDRKAIVTLLAEQENFFIANVVEDNFALVNSAVRQHPDVIVMDFCLEDLDILSLAPIIKRNSPATALVVLCSPEDNVTVDQILRAGISGYLRKRHDFVNLALSVRCVFCGGLYFSNETRKKVFGYFATRSIAELGAENRHSDTHGIFTPTELQVFLGIIRGYSDNKIANDLHISAGSVRNCICQAKKKSGLHNRTQLSIYVLSVGLIAWENDFLKAVKTRGAVTRNTAFPDLAQIRKP